jgi:UDP-glucose:(heptosyl)LPS alpha-1,3-glucosyltransferase
MKILFARRGYSSSGGAERYLARLVRGLHAKTIETTLLTDGAWPSDQWPGDHRISLEAHSPVAFASAVEKERSKHPDALLFSFERIPCADVFRAGDGVHTAYLNRQAGEGNPLATLFRGIRRHHRETCALENQLFTKNDHLHVICNSKMVASELRSFFNFPEKRITTIYNGFTPKPWDARERTEARKTVRSQLGIPPDAPLILFVGSGWKRKGAETLASAFRQITSQDAHLVLVGKGRLKQALPPRVHLTGPVPAPRDYYLAADLFALPTLYDPFSNACLEAAAYGLPVITTDGNGFAETIASFPESGEVIPNPRDPAAWAQTLDRWLAKSPKADPLDSLVEAHTMDLNVTRTVELLTELAAQRIPDISIGTSPDPS